MEPQAAIEALALTVESVFVPFSQSRSKDQDQPNLNWRVTVKRNGREILTTDYSAGMAHAPGYTKPRAGNFYGSDSLYRRIVTRAECEKGKPVVSVLANDSCLHGKNWIEPNPCDVIYSLVMDSDVIDYAGFEDWAENMGVNPDSRKIESTYRACLETALKMRAALGEEGMGELREAFQDY